MSQSFPPPQQPQQPPQQPGFPGFVPAPPPAPVRDNFAGGLITAIVAAVVSAGVYGAIIGATKHEIGYAAVGVGFLVGWASGKVGGRNPALPVLSAVLALAAVYAGQLVGVAIVASKAFPVSATDLLLKHIDAVNEIWKADADAMTFLFFAIAAIAAFSGSKKAAA
ncbi:hypothetical protein A8W25_18490 [Streptomyces sp. ERV7]|uniref:hypothetical protein n=1 Tax=Streptomyces sp. ERV7 TaxID=1322334 RepID=UPI0007F453FF|nr:hypothetical protein [Streptomyces sp. ERV7]OAR24399.1 hypothetical protein A8W25_18490 [Streptomyces sp. ERV7]